MQTRPLASKRWFEGWLSVLLGGAETNQWIIAIGSYGYDWINGGTKAELISFPEAMSRASNAEIPSAWIAGPEYNPYFYYADAGKVHPGMDADATFDAFPGRAFHGAVTQVIRSAVDASQSVVVDLDNAGEKLRPGMTATIRIRNH